MKNILILIASIIVGIAFATMIAGDGATSLKTIGKDLLQNQITNMQTIE